jgi:hypothetical protein
VHFSIASVVSLTTSFAPRANLLHCIVKGRKAIEVREIYVDLAARRELTNILKSQWPSTFTI